MKSFLEWMKLRSESYHVIGEDHDDPFSGEIYITGSRELQDWDWSIERSFFVSNYVLKGSDGMGGNPVQHKNGVEFKDPGHKLENLPEPLKSQALKWVESQFENIIYRDEYAPRGRR